MVGAATAKAAVARNCRRLKRLEAWSVFILGRFVY
jgi:hypothetical protein